MAAYNPLAICADAKLAASDGTEAVLKACSASNEAVLKADTAGSEAVLEPTMAPLRPPAAVRVHAASPSLDDMEIGPQVRRQPEAAASVGSAAAAVRLRSPV